MTLDCMNKNSKKQEKFIKHEPQLVSTWAVGVLTPKTDHQQEYVGEGQGHGNDTLSRNKMKIGLKEVHRYWKRNRSTKNATDNFVK